MFCILSSSASWLITWFQEAELRVDFLQQHAALIGGPNATSCPICHKLFLGGEALMEHMKLTHKDPNNSSEVPSKYPEYQVTRNP